MGFFSFGKKNDKEDDKGDKKDDEEKKEEEEEEKEEDEEDDDEVEDAAPEDEDDYTLFPIEAQDWAQKVLGDPAFAKYYSIAKNRSESDAREMLTQRLWKVTIKNIRFTNQGSEHDVFIKFCFGHDLRVSRRFKRSKGQIEGGPPGKGGKGGKKNAPREFEWVVKGSSGKVRLTEVKKKISKGARADFDDEFEFSWHGSYFDLYKKNLHAEVWDWNFLSPNTYIASYSKTLRAICAGTMDQEWDIYTEVRKRGKVEKVNVGSLTFTVIFQEVLEYTVKLSNWNATLDLEEYLAMEEDKVQELVPFALFHLHSPLHYVGSSKRIVSKPIKHQVKGVVKWLKIDFGQLREMKFKGTRMEFESGELYVTIYDNTQTFMPTPVASKALAFAVIPLKAVMEVGVLSSYLTKATKSSGTSIPALRVAGAYISSAASSLGSALSKQFSAMTGAVRVNNNRDAVEDYTPPLSVGSIRGNLDVEVPAPKLGMDSILHPTMVVSRALGFNPTQYNLFREFAQFGEPNPPELRDYPPYYQAYLCVRVIQARNLYPADATGTSDPYVVVRWGDQELKTRIMYATLRPDFHEELYFLVRSNDPKNIRIEELARTPEIKIMVYDYDPAGSSDLLGHTSVYLHQITGCGVVEAVEEEEDEQMRRIPTRPVQSVTVRRRNNPGAPLRPVTIQTRVFRQELPLEGVLPDYKSTVLVECFFRTWEGDLKERMSKIRNKTHSDYIVLPPLKMLAKEKDTPCLCHSVFSFERSAWEVINEQPSTWELHRRMCASSRPLPRKKAEEEQRKLAMNAGGTRGVCELLKEFQQRLQATSLPSRSYLYKMEMEQDPPNRKSVSEPRRIDDLKPDLRSGDERKERTLGEFLRRETLDCEDFLAKDFFGNRHWLPQFLHPLTPPKSMIDPEEAKYMVITSSKLPNAQFAAAQMVKAIEFWDMKEYHITTFSQATWIDPGTLLTMKKGDMKAHALLLCNLFLGLQTDAYVCLGYARTEPTKEEVLALRERARENGWPTKKFEAELERMRGELQPCVWVMTRESSGEAEYGEEYKNVGSVKFWDVTHGTYYPPLPGRWRGQNDEEKLKLFKKPQSKSKHKKKVPRPSSPGHSTTGPSKDSKLEDPPMQNPADRRPAGAINQALLPDQGLAEEDLLETFDQTHDGGLGTDVGVDVNEVFELGVGAGDGWGRSASSDEDDENTRQAPLPDLDGEGGRKKEVRLDAFKYERIRDDLARTGWTARFKRLMGRRQFALEKRIREVLPFTHIVAIFNHKNLWVNAQHYLDPTKITYDLEENDFGWIPVLPYRVAEHTQPFYPPKTLTPKLTEDRITQLRTNIEDELEAGMTNARSARGLFTKFAPHSMKKLLRKYLENLNSLAELDHSKKNGW